VRYTSFQRVECLTSVSKISGQMGAGMATRPGKRSVCTQNLKAIATPLHAHFRHLQRVFMPAAPVIESEVAPNLIAAWT
jgi:hypothetical protein